MMTQTLAVLWDAYRELNSKKMFWIVIILNVLAIGAFGMLGANENSLSFLWYEMANSRQLGGSPQFLYKYLYSYLIVGFWFTWIAAGLALVSTAGIFPDLLSSGSIDLYLSKPIGRLRLFFTKYMAGLLFVTLQVTLFTLGSFLVLGVRAGLWEPGLFWAIPLVVLFFSYLFAICVLIGVWTRSTIAALLVTILVWTVIGLTNYVDRQISRFAYAATAQHAEADARIDAINQQISRERQSGSPQSADRIVTLESRREYLQQEKDRNAIPPALEMTRKIFYGVKTVMPKTGETVGVLDRVLFKDPELRQTSSPEFELGEDDLGMRRSRNNGFAEMGIDIAAQRDRPIWWIVGTSLLFEAVVITLAAWIFCRRDY